MRGWMSALTTDMINLRNRRVGKGAPFAPCPPPDIIKQDGGLAGAQPTLRHQRGCAPHVPRHPFGISNTRQVVVACASRRPLESVMRASAVEARRPTLSVRPSDFTGPVPSVMPLMKEILNSSVV